MSDSELLQTDDAVAILVVSEEEGFQGCLEVEESQLAVRKGERRTGFQDPGDELLVLDVPILSLWKGLPHMFQVLLADRFHRRHGGAQEPLKLCPGNCACVVLVESTEKKPEL